MPTFRHIEQPSGANPDLRMLAELMRKIPQLTAADIDELLPLWTRRGTLRRGEFLSQFGQVENHLYFMLKGTMRIYMPLPEEDAYTGFAYPGTMVTSVPSFLSGQPSEFCVQALQQCELLAISRADWMRLVEQNPNFGRFWRLEMERAVLGLIERQIDLLLPEPQQRLERVLKRSPHLFQLIPKRHIAAYLRMTPETLSRLGAVKS
ncbi:Crp/Fnr family transcriptional regulator [Hymenobacter edaphi]|uniref:Crp/Fnr family transcriptional regulator n=1 Tax=Hymenobacter edaphi TaxID=2211146 RepID=A0A328BHT9_9BACT|nr:Crp/Fnr family transcriptional regulator [Hymenobacter edaphi]RAK64628.1 Crp/Fnr family transcriptional regulator [Hymenobacter edaphi]